MFNINPWTVLLTMLAGVVTFTIARITWLSWKVKQLESEKTLKEQSDEIKKEVQSLSDSELRSQLKSELDRKDSGGR
jgi:type VI protein secretion system component VasK